MRHLAFVLHEIMLDISPRRDFEERLPIDHPGPELRIRILLLRIDGCGNTVSGLEVLKMQQLYSLRIFPQVRDWIRSRVNYMAAVHFECHPLRIGRVNEPVSYTHL